MVIDVITPFCRDTGIDAVGQRELALNYLNQAAQEIHKQLECTKIFREITLVVPANRIVSLPGFIGELRGMRPVISDIPFKLQSAGQPRYVNSNWSYLWRNWRDMNDSPILRSLNSVAPLTLEAAVIEDEPVDVLISGQTNNAARIEETVTMSSSPQTTVNNFGPAIYQIACLSDNRTSDIVVKDEDGNEIAVLYNFKRRTSYKIVDVSQLGWTDDTGSQETLVDVLYKEPLQRMYQDTDSFPAGDDYDIAWYHMAMWCYYIVQPGNEAKSGQSRLAAQVTLNNIKSTTEAGEEKRVTFGRNKFYDLIPDYPWSMPGYWHRGWPC